ncbi:MAG: TolC family protein [Chitinophagaceae bacterium]|nr:TolC family protein [Chitinophagaceae bacterium]MBP6478656.1 TolC family protein [Chitinophagaceae bacterium]MBP7108681.1 TolC family protein [Chitinophagaceae bacterium]MBP7313731.1 TolC family protein [Chitinophagaceae bacterium]
MNNMKNILLPFLLFITLTSSAQKVLTIEEAIATALQNNYAIQLSKNDSAIAALDYSFRNAAFLPRINGSFGGTYNNNNQRQKFADGTERKLNDIKSNNYNAGLQMNWVVFDGLKMFATRDKLEEFVKLGELGIKQQIVNTIASVITNYYAIVRQKQQLKAINDQIQLSAERVKLAQYKLDIGVGAKPDVLQSKVDLNAQKAAYLSQETIMSQLREQLNQLINIEPESKYLVSDTILINMNVSLGDIQESLENNNPDLLMAQKNIDIARLVLKERKADRFPTVSLNSGYTFNRTNNKATVNPFQPLFSRNFGRNLGFTIAVPILNNFTTKRLIKQSAIDIQYQQLFFENQKSILNLNVINAYKDYELQKRALALEEENIVLANENVAIVFEVYKLNSTTLIQLKEAQKSLEDAQTRLINARYNTKLAETELLRLKGEIIK